MDSEERKKQMAEEQRKALQQLIKNPKHMKYYIDGKVIPTEEGALFLAEDIYNYVLEPAGW